MSSNLLSIPYKKTYSLDIKEGLKNYLQQREGRNPAQFRDDIIRWHDLRQDAVGDQATVHVHQVDLILKYHAQLLAILTKLPDDIGLDIVYNTVFKPSNSIPITLRNLTFERASLIFNLGSLYSQLAYKEDRSQVQGIRRVISLNQNAAGAFDYLLEHVIPKLSYPPDTEETPLDLTREFVQTVRLLCLAQAQESIWQVAKLESRKNGIQAKLAISASNLYRSAHETGMNPNVRHLFPAEFLTHIETKGLFFAAVSKYRKSIEEGENARYGIEIARLREAQTSAKKAYDLARRGRVSPALVKDAQSLSEMLTKQTASVERDNDYIYHQEVPPSSALPEIQPADLAKATIPPALLSPESLVDRPLFAGLVGWGTREAINIYNDRKKKFVEQQVEQAIHEMKDVKRKQLQKRQLPASLDALSKSVGLPPSLLGKGEEVRNAQGPQRIERGIEDVRELSANARKLLEEGLDILDEEVSQDEAGREASPLVAARESSQEANTELVAKAERYRYVLDQGASGDQDLRAKWEEWEERIGLLTLDEEGLERHVPSSAFSSSSSNLPTRQHSQALRGLMEELDRLHLAADDLVRRAQALCEADDIEPRILKAARGFENTTSNVRPEHFEDLMDEEIAKYDRFLQSVRELREKQEGLLEKVGSEHELFLQSRKVDPDVQARADALQDLEAAYHQYIELVGHLEEGYKFYNDLTQLISQWKTRCGLFLKERSQEIESLTASMSRASLNSEATIPASQTTANTSSPLKSSGQRTSQPLPPTTTSSPPVPAPSGSEFNFPPPDSEEWEEMYVPPPPVPRAAVPSSEPAEQLTSASFPSAPEAFDFPPPDSDEWQEMYIPPPPPQQSGKGKKRLVQEPY